MKRPSKILYSVVLSAVMMMTAVPAMGDNILDKIKSSKIFGRKTAKTESVGTAPKEASPAEQKRVVDLDDLSFTEMINSVELDAKSSGLIQQLQEKEGRNRLHNKEYNSKNGSTVETYRNKEVLLITIPASKLFAPNDVDLRKDASGLLAPLKRYLKDPDMYRVLLVMHTDNTGNESYREYITEERANSVFDWFVDQGCDTRYLFSYAFSDDMPLVENNSMANRDRNRRLEVYLVPGKKMLDEAKKGRIVF